MSDTPRTDEAIVDELGQDQPYVPIEFCRHLERELNEMHATALDYAASSDHYAEGAFALRAAIKEHKDAFHAKGWNEGEDFDEKLWESITK
jgi:hypothetical protein